MKLVFEISPKFTIEDIHKIREFHYEMTKKLSKENRRKYYTDPVYAKEVDEINKDIAELVYLQA